MQLVIATALFRKEYRLNQPDMGCRMKCSETWLKKHSTVESSKSWKVRLRWFGNVKRRDEDYVGRQTLETVPHGRRRGRRRKQRWMVCVNRDIRVTGRQKMRSMTELAGGERLCLPWLSWSERPDKEVDASSNVPGCLYGIDPCVALGLCLRLQVVLSLALLAIVDGKAELKNKNMHQLFWHQFKYHSHTRSKTYNSQELSCS